MWLTWLIGAFSFTSIKKLLSLFNEKASEFSRTLKSTIDLNPDQPVEDIEPP